MSRPTGGYVKLYRKILNSWVAEDPIAFTMLCHLVMWANREDGRAALHRQLKPLHRGQVATSDAELAVKLRCDRKTIRRRLEHLQDDGILAIDRDNHGTIITINNYNRYQSSKESGGTAEGTAEGTHRETKRRETERLKKGNAPAPAYARNDPPKVDPDPHGEALKAAQWFAEAVRAMNPHAKIPIDLGGWAYELQSTAEETGRTVREVIEVAQWAIGDAKFWSGVITAPSKLAEKWDQVTAQMARDRRRNRPGWMDFEGRE